MYPVVNMIVDDCNLNQYKVRQTVQLSVIILYIFFIEKDYISRIHRTSSYIIRVSELKIVA